MINGYSTSLKLRSPLGGQLSLSFIVLLLVSLLLNIIIVFTIISFDHYCYYCYHC